ncbi:hypothetical protein MBCUT_16900 [Methanobrevibacter cuticularis]|uniref:DUF4367 domain-containing protein n=1 Tax=Methanobrevibacter cuticularis TaxID=47311 RepID=A0A166D5J6_9EURY|nr:hypothetical protein [Methanobrevibacter cuticularis]KZX15230.1 hypothetical protein MBCUT_16900 [Methanobrevibacter cuticularis]
MESKGKKFLTVFLGVVVLLCLILAVFTFNFVEDHQMKYKSETIGGYTFNIPEEFKLESEDSSNNSYAKIYSNEQASLGILVRKNINLSEKEILYQYNVSNYTNVKFSYLKGYKTEKYSFVNYYFKINNDLILIDFINLKNTNILVEKILKNIS